MPGVNGYDARSSLPSGTFTPLIAGLAGGAEAYGLVSDGSLLSVSLKTKTINQTLRIPNPRTSRRRNKRFNNLTIQPTQGGSSPVLLFYARV